MIFNVYLICAEVQGKRLYKIGFTRRTIEKRINDFRTGNGAEFYIVDSFQSKWGTKIEARLKRMYKTYCISGEWFDLPDSEILEFRNICISLHANIDLLMTNNTYIINGGRF